MVKFIVDSTFGVTREYARENDIKIVSLTLLLNGKEYDEGYPDEWDTFYKEYVRSKAAAKTSQPSPDKYRVAIDEIFAQDENSRGAVQRQKGSRNKFQRGGSVRAYVLARNGKSATGGRDYGRAFGVCRRA